MGNILKETSGLGVIVCRMQVPYLTESHKAVINTVLDRHNRVVVFLGCSNDGMTFKNPFTFEFRKKMLMDTFYNNKNLNIIPLPDIHNDNKLWVTVLDNMIRAFLSLDDTATLYGGRDSFIPYYEKDFGNYKCVELAPTDYDSGTELRALSSLQQPIYTPESAQAILWALRVGVINIYDETF